MGGPGGAATLAGATREAALGRRGAAKLAAGVGRFPSRVPRLCEPCDVGELGIRGARLADPWHAFFSRFLLLAGVARNIAAG